MKKTKLSKATTSKSLNRSRQPAYVQTEKSESFWQFRPFSRVVNWGNDFKTCAKYLKQNVLEALGFIPHEERKNYYAKWLKETVCELNELIEKSLNQKTKVDV